MKTAEVKQNNFCRFFYFEYMYAEKFLFHYILYKKNNLKPTVNRRCFRNENKSVIK